MAFNKLGLNLSVFQNANIPNSTDFDLGTTTTEVLNKIPEKANEITNNYYGLGVMIVLFFYLVYKLGDFIELNGQPYSTVRSVGIAGGIVSMLGINMLSLGYFTEYFHVVIFMGILMISTLVVWLEDKR